MGSLGIEDIEEEIMNLSSGISTMSSIGSSIGSTSWLTISSSSSLPLLSLNHVSFVCKSIADSVRFYVDVLGFVLVKRPSSFQFEGAWLFNYGIGIHLLECNNLKRKKSKINPKENHISFQCSDMNMVIRKLEDMKIEYVTAQVQEGGIKVDQLFFHDPDGYMLEICNCHVLPILPLSSCPLQRTLKVTKTQPSSSIDSSEGSKLLHCSGEVEAQLMDSLMMDMLSIAF